MATGGIDKYRANLRNAVYGFWRGAFDMSQFIHMMSDRVWDGLKAAWYAGAAKAGILPDELTDREISTMQTDIFNQLQYIPGFAEFIQKNSRANKGKLETVLFRMNLWVARYKDMENRGWTMAAKNQKLTWILGHPKTEHCPDCLRVANKTKRASTWYDSGWIPQSYDLACHGGCLCHFEPTNARCTPGKLPKLR